MKEWLMEEESGQGLVEYALIIVSVVLVAVLALSGVGHSVAAKIIQIATKLQLAH